MKLSMKRIFTILFVLISFASTQEIFSQTLTQSGFNSVLLPRYMAQGTSTRLPYVFRATLTGLTANAKYIYFNQMAIRTDIGGTNPGAGNPLFINKNPYRYSTGASLTNPNGHDTITADATGNYTGWFGVVHTGNARFTAGNYIMPTIAFKGTTVDTAVRQRALNDSILVLQFSASAGANNGTGIYGISVANPRNIITLWDNVAGTGRPLAVTFVEAMGLNSGDIASLVTYYADSVITRNGRWGTIIPNTLANGVRRVNVHLFSNGDVVNFATDADGTWPSGANTVNPSGGTTPIRLTSADALLLTEVLNTTPESFKLKQNYPNPFNPVTNIEFSIPKNGFVNLKVFNALGQEVSSLVNQTMNTGTYSVQFNGQNLNSGIYFYTLQYIDNSNNVVSDTKKLMLIK